MYRAYGYDDLLLYVGCTKDVGNRLKQHRQSSRWYYRSEIIKVRNFESAEYAAEVERRAISRLCPVQNIQHQRDYRSRLKAVTRDKSAFVDRRPRSEKLIGEIDAFMRGQFSPVISVE
ncbi:GIY-YIG nuclease family protein [Shimia sediminis]|uniref:GIY-YIG nuclease family protein n=1 Tax=Shimia sediminis TaxID=2497945 RepID=UPI0013DE83F9|nr:GIY-YIG nuclease family protein [Shimia sediminis]